MTEITQFGRDDADDVAALFQSVFRDPNRDAPRSLTDYLRQLYLEMPGCDPEIMPLVHRGANGRVNGFVGVTVVRMQHCDRPVRAAICGPLMVNRDDADPMIAPRLLKTFLAGPQDLSFSETTGDASTRMWVGLRGNTMPTYSLDWVRVLKPASFLVDIGTAKVRQLGLMAPAARWIDTRRARRMAKGALRWSGLPSEWPIQGGLHASEIDADRFSELVEPLTSHFPVRPIWQAGQLAAILSDAQVKPATGKLILCQVSKDDASPIGAFAYHVREGGIARVLQVLSRPGLAGPVLDCLMLDAANRGASGLRGRIQPPLLEAMMGRRIWFTHTASSVVHSRDKTLLDACLNGQVFFNGLCGELWNRLNGGSFD
jgi:hypothetical protein